MREIKAEAEIVEEEEVEAAHKNLSHVSKKITKVNLPLYNTMQAISHLVNKRAT